ncbi:hypothetical protein C8R43DRAFT_1132704 [Mycena crocata]|nr:hypothetical protein C8R43DRAFT_1132704 [Mycena crocata]
MAGCSKLRHAARLTVLTCLTALLPFVFVSHTTAPPAAYDPRYTLPHHTRIGICTGGQISCCQPSSLMLFSVPVSTMPLLR